MKVLFLSICLLLVMSQNLLFGQPKNTSTVPINQVGYQETLALVLKAEKKAMARRMYMKNRKTDPDYEFTSWRAIFQKEAPALIANPEQHAHSLLMILKSQEIEKDEGFNVDLVRVLYPICIEQYAEVIHTVHGLYSEGKVDLFTLALTANPSFYFCSNVYENRHNQILQQELQHVADLLKPANSPYEELVTSGIKDLLSGKEDEDYQEFITNHSPYLPNKPCKSEK
ncbi:hypothetical protein [Rufibacter hautae]|uniref:DUF4476 domain-containing protein n=1 Tax=Rufibacter hautae TaxID=2595005 RepID=A0A5B6TCY3_9BACT|nr:hypothetical protein [Rufibacter hautae]KAA3438026.1 hypothetical protein FOA19_12175 [Rufibacter hautae]